MLTFIVQARTGSTRLPNKILLPFHRGESILSLLIAKLRKIKNTQIIIATSDNKNCDVIDEFARQHEVCCYRGSENDVLKRFIDAADEFGVADIIRICSDNPFLELKGLNDLVNYIQKDLDYDYISFLLDGVPSIKTHYGFWGEYVKLEALKKVASLTDESLYHEHVTNYIYTHPNYFKIHWLSPSSERLEKREIRLTIDTEIDFKTAQKLYQSITELYPYPSIDNIIDYLDKNSDYYKTMQEQIKLNTK